MKILLVKPNENPIVTDIDYTLKAMQRVVDGHIEITYPFANKKIALICNEEGKINDLPLNRTITDETGEVIDYIAGDFFICQRNDKMDFESLSEENIKICTKIFSL